ncbi:MAG TPA: dihydrolipoamide acetyltransferase family protein [Dermatophilaceae bacterium]|nr:dihydrolipoamide acetyltransferase family protein [Dermatophilaceae bacterium]
MSTASAVESVRQFKMPDVGEGLTEAEILTWYVKPGDTVEDGQVVCEVETAKAAVELPIPFDGVVHELRFPEGETVDVGTVIIAVDTGEGEGGEPAAGTAPEPAAAPAPAAEPEQKRQPVLVGYGVAASSTKRRPRRHPAVPAQTPARQAVQGELNGHAPVPAAAASFAPAEVRPLAKPPVRKLAKDLGIDLTQVPGSGEGGVVTRADVESYAAGGGSAATTGSGAGAGSAYRSPVFSARGEREVRIPIKGVRKVTAQAMVGSAFTAPHVTEFITVDVTRTMKLVERLRTDREFRDVKVSPLLVVAKAVLIASRRNPGINATWDEAAQEIVVKGYVNLGIAAATPRGLMVPNIKDADQMSMRQLADAMANLVSTARDGRTQPADMSGGSITITNVGVFGVDTGTPILNPGEAAILCFGAVRQMPWVVKGKVKVRWVTQLGVSFDHRLVDGDLGSRFLADVAAVLHDPGQALVWG